MVAAPRIDKVFLLSQDLMFTSQIGSVAKSLQLNFQVISDLTRVADENTYHLLIVDLEFPGLDFDQLSMCLENHNVSALCYASHVKEHLFASARNASLTELYSRGQIHSNLKQILSEYL